jgi:hypothetical protein
MKSLLTPFDHNGECLYCDEMGEHTPTCPVTRLERMVADYEQLPEEGQEDIRVMVKMALRVHLISVRHAAEASRHED